MSTPTPARNLLVIFFFLLFFVGVFGIQGDRAIKVRNNYLVPYLKFGFLNGGLIMQEFELEQKQAGDSFTFLFICDDYGKQKMLNAANNNNLCRGEKLLFPMDKCAYKHIIYNDLDGSTKILPFKSDAFSRLIVKYLANTTTSDGDTSSSDASGSSFFDSLQEGGIVGARVLTQVSSGESEADSTAVVVDLDVDFFPEEEDENAAVELNFLEVTEEAENSDDDDEKSVLKDQLMQQVLTAWMLYEDPDQLEDMGNLKVIGGSLKKVNITKDDPNIYSKAMLSTENLASFLPNNFSHRVHEEDMHYFMVLNCDTSSKISIDYSVLNPGGEHLSTGEIENKGIYHLMVFGWIVLCAFWIVTWVRNRFKKHKTYSLHYFFLLSGLLCLALVVIEKEYWFNLSDTGIPILSLKISAAVLRSVIFTLLFALFMLIGKGYTYINLTLSRRDKLYTFVFVTMRFMIACLGEFFGFNLFITVIMTIVYFIESAIIWFSFRRNFAKINFVLDSIQAFPPANPNLLRAIGASLDNVPGDEVQVEINNGNNQNEQAQAEPAGTLNNIPAAAGSTTNRRAREPVRSFERDIKLLKKKMMIVKLLRLLVLGHIFAFCLANIIAFILFVNQPYVLNLWYQILLSITFFVFTWFFNYEHKLAFIYSNIRGFDDEHSQVEMKSMKVKKTPNTNIEDFYKITGNFVIVENAFNTELRLASFIPSRNTEKPKDSNSPSPKKSSPKMKKKAAKYLVDDSNSVIALESILKEEGIVIKKEAVEEPQDEKYLDIGNISLHFNDEESEEKVEVQVEKEQTEKVDMMMSLYPKPRMAKAIDFRSEICNGSFYH